MPGEEPPTEPGTRKRIRSVPPPRFTAIGARSWTPRLGGFEEPCPQATIYSPFSPPCHAAFRSASDSSTTGFPSRP